VMMCETSLPTWAGEGIKADEGQILK